MLSTMKLYFEYTVVQLFIFYHIIWETRVMYEKKKSKNLYLPPDILKRLWLA